MIRRLAHKLAPPQLEHWPLVALVQGMLQVLFAAFALQALNVLPFLLLLLVVLLIELWGIVGVGAYALELTRVRCAEPVGVIESCLVIALAVAAGTLEAGAVL